MLARLERVVPLGDRPVRRRQTWPTKSNDPVGGTGRVDVDVVADADLGLLALREAHGIRTTQSGLGWTVSVVPLASSSTSLARLGCDGGRHGRSTALVSVVDGVVRA